MTRGFWKKWFFMPAMGVALVGVLAACGGGGNPSELPGEPGTEPGVETPGEPAEPSAPEGGLEDPDAGSEEPGAGAPADDAAGEEAEDSVDSEEEGGLEDTGSDTDMEE